MIVEELNQTAKWARHCRNTMQGAKHQWRWLGLAEATKFNAGGKDRILGMQLIMNADRDKYSTLIKDYNREYLGGIHK